MNLLATLLFCVVLSFACGDEIILRECGQFVGESNHVYKLIPGLTTTPQAIQNGVCLYFRDSTNITIEGQKSLYTLNLNFFLCEGLCENFSFQNIFIAGNAGTIEFESVYGLKMENLTTRVATTLKIQNIGKTVTITKSIFYPSNFYVPILYVNYGINWTVSKCDFKGSTAFMADTCDGLTIDRNTIGDTTSIANNVFVISSTRGLIKISNNEIRVKLIPLDFTGITVTCNGDTSLVISNNTVFIYLTSYNGCVRNIYGMRIDQCQNATISYSFIFMFYSESSSSLIPCTNATSMGGFYITNSNVLLSNTNISLMPSEIKCRGDARGFLQGTFGIYSQSSVIEIRDTILDKVYTMEQLVNQPFCNRLPYNAYGIYIASDNIDAKLSNVVIKKVIGSKGQHQEYTAIGGIGDYRGGNAAGIQWEGGGLSISDVDISEVIGGSGMRQLATFYDTLLCSGGSGQGLNNPNNLVPQIIHSNINGSSIRDGYNCTLSYTPFCSNQMENSQVVLTCPPNRPIDNIQLAVYGRLNNTFCGIRLPASPYYTSEGDYCGVNVTQIIMDKCLHHTTCQFMVDDRMFPDPCPNYTKFLGVGFTCGPVVERNDTISLDCARTAQATQNVSCKVQLKLSDNRLQYVNVYSDTLRCISGCNVTSDSPSHDVTFESSDEQIGLNSIYGVLAKEDFNVFTDVIVHITPPTETPITTTTTTTAIATTTTTTSYTVHLCAYQNGGCDIRVKCIDLGNGETECGECPIGTNGTGKTGCKLLCGDGVCNSDYEDCITCPIDCKEANCSKCGDLVCDPSEDCQSCPDDCSCGVCDCSGRGTCIGDVCVCEGPWSGVKCETNETVPIPVTPDPYQPSFDLNEEDFFVSFHSISEIDENGKTIRKVLTGDKKTMTFYKTKFVSGRNSLHNYTAKSGEFIVTLLAWDIKDPQTLTFVNKTWTFPANTFKFNIIIQNWAFQNIKNKLHVELEQYSKNPCTHEYEIEEDNTNNNNNNNAISYLMVAGVNTTLHGKLLGVADVDGRERRFDYFKKGSSVFAVLPHFWYFAEMDPQFSLRSGGKISNANNKEEIREYTCEESSEDSNNNTIIVICVIASICGLIIVVLGIIFFARQRKSKQYKAEMIPPQDPSNYEEY